MKVNFEAVLVDLNLDIITGKESKPATVKSIVIDALLATFQDEASLSGEEKMKRYVLATSIHKGANEVSVEDVGMIKKLVGKAYAPLIVGQVWQVLEGK